MITAIGKKYIFSSISAERSMSLLTAKPPIEFTRMKTAEIAAISFGLAQLVRYNKGARYMPPPMPERPDIIPIIGVHAHTQFFEIDLSDAWLFPNNITNAASIKQQASIIP